MARHQPNKHTQLADDTASIAEGTTQIPGGAEGFIPDAATVIPGVRSVGAATPAEPGPKVQRFRVVNGGRINYDSSLVRIPAGKEVSELTHDLSVLRGQGIVLEPIAEEA